MIKKIKEYKKKPWLKPEISNMEDFKESKGGGKPSVEALFEKNRSPGGTPVSAPS
tara:strand:+ start:503 stop:667 length:165 start_codon:yes stop_codon:yes gene_type:complete